MEDDIRPVVPDAGQPVIAVSKVSADRKNVTAPKGRRSLIEKAILRAIELSAPNADDVNVVFDKLIELALEYPEKFRPLIGYKNGQVLYGKGGKEMTYSKNVLREFLKRRRG
jgi:hypothetical protein